MFSSKHTVLYHSCYVDPTHVNEHRLQQNVVEFLKTSPSAATGQHSLAWAQPWEGGGLCAHPPEYSNVSRSSLRLRARVSTNAPSPTPREKRKGPAAARPPLHVARPWIASALPVPCASRVPHRPLPPPAWAPPPPRPAPGLQALAHPSRSYSLLFESNHTHLPV